MEFIAGLLIAAFIAYCHYTTKAQRELHLLFVWGLMFLSIIWTVGYHFVVRVLLR